MPAVQTSAPEAASLGSHPKPSHRAPFGLVPSRALATSEHQDFPSFPISVKSQNDSITHVGGQERHENVEVPVSGCCWDRGSLPASGACLVPVAGKSEVVLPDMWRKKKQNGHRKKLEINWS
jgi:hypothetical protein